MLVSSNSGIICYKYDQNEAGRRDVTLKLKCERDTFRLIWKDPNKMLSRTADSVMVSDVLEVVGETRCFSDRENVVPEHFVCIEVSSRTIGMEVKDQAERDELVRGLKSLVADLHLREGKMSAH